MIAKIKKAVIPVAGLGARMLPATKAIPKELLPVYDRPIIEHVVKEAIAAGITEIILVTRSGKEAIENHFDAHYELEHRLEKKGKETILGTVKNIIATGVTVSSIRQSDALDELLKLDGLNVFETDAGIFDCGNKQGFLSANLAVGMRDPDTRRILKRLLKRVDGRI